MQKIGSFTLEDYQEMLRGLEPECRWCKTKLGNEPIQHYPHGSGWFVKGMQSKQWLYVECPKCQYQWALWKLGIKR